MLLGTVAPSLSWRSTGSRPRLYVSGLLSSAEEDLGEVDHFAVDFVANVGHLGGDLVFLVVAVEERSQRCLGIFKLGSLDTFEVSDHVRQRVSGQPGLGAGADELRLRVYRRCRGLFSGTQREGADLDLPASHGLIRTQA